MIRCYGFRWSNTEVLSPKKGQAEGSKKGNGEEIKTPSTEDINALKRKIAKKRKIEALRKEEAELEAKTRKRKRSRRERRKKKIKKKTNNNKKKQKIKDVKRKKQKKQKKAKKHAQRRRTVLDTNFDMYSMFRCVAQHVQKLDLGDLNLHADLTVEFAGVANATVHSVRQARAFIVAWKFGLDSEHLKKRAKWDNLCARVSGVEFDGGKNAGAELQKEGFEDFPQSMVLVSNHIFLTEFKSSSATLPTDSKEFRKKTQVNPRDSSFSVPSCFSSCLSSYVFLSCCASACEFSFQLSFFLLQRLHLPFFRDLPFQRVNIFC